MAGNLAAGPFSAQKIVSAEQVIQVALREPGARARAEHIASNIRAYDERALGIAAMAQDTSRSTEERAVACVKAILQTYYPEDAGKIAEVTFENALVGMALSRNGKGGEAKLKLVVGRDAVEQMPTMLAAEVLRVGHELQHVEQYQQGLHGRKHRHKAEFLAYHWEATAEAPAGTGVVARAKRLSWCEEGLKHYGKLSPEQQQSYRHLREELLEVKRAWEAPASR